MRFAELDTVKFRLLKVLEGLRVVVKREITLGHRLIRRSILAIREVLLPILELSFCLGIFKSF